MYSVTPVTPDSAGILIGAAGNAANDKRNKTIMNCLRDRTPSYSRSNSRGLVRYENSITAANRPDPTIFLKEPRSRPNKLALLQSTSTRDLSRLLEESGTTSNPNIFLKEPRSRTNKLALLKSTSTRDISRLLEESGTSSNSSSNHSQSAASYCDANCARRMQEMEQRLTLCEKELSDQRAYTKQLELKVIELTRRLDELNEIRQVEKRKKSSSFRKKTNAGQNTVQPSKLVAWMNLSNLWKHRPSIETLKEKNIYNDEPCFDTEIEMVLKHEIHKTVPKIVVDCCDLIDEKYRKSPDRIEGIYRQCGDYNKIQTLRFRIDANEYDALLQPNIDIHTLTGVLKLFLREIKSPLVNTNEAKTFIGKPNHWLLTELPVKIETLKRLIRSIPEVNRDTMQYLFAHFHKLTKVPLQSVSAETLSLSVTPSIFHTVHKGVHMQDIHVLLKESEVLADCVKIMIEYHSRIFEST